MVKAYAWQRVTVTLPHSEVNMHLRVAGRTCKVDVLPEGVQLLDDDNQPLSFPITHGEAGVEYVGLPDAGQCADKGHTVSVQFDNSWHCYHCEIYGARS